jgi:hypothetical protein
MSDRKIVDISIEGIDHRDAPDYCDAYIASASWDDGTELTEEELQELNEDRSFVYEKVIDWIY